MATTSSWGQLYIVATPIGNLSDMVPRAIETLQQVSLIAAEDTRHSARLMDYFQIATPMTAYHDFSDNDKTEKLISSLKAGEDIALISDAGTPLISDPGYRLVQVARSEGIRVVPIPGACALIAALSASGLPTDKFRFEGFLPAKATARVKTLESLKSSDATLVFYEAPHRIVACLSDIAATFGDQREVVVARELTKTYETFLSGTVAEVADKVQEDTNQQKGEFVVMVGPGEQKLTEIDSDTERLMGYLLEELPLKKASVIAAKYTGLKKKQLYDWGLNRQ
ncbi:16S rRNA (cytidine(1402)-2'-O)-methyltransferase [Sessilibacter corallicola]|uniref:16S rRNA (cytidine(1402)-2'-O)-methyltransferase n=1 Tax=Sessilibacter corallicola TaxID=2904075 RepID=UPI001E49A84A|nr:16S rRNA (cytidine(1402)-2'-O)-methyltransferase [Sessilibacter corallicola]MCE2027123.1 16S rRNA (cytidine(1402)-2'-O)-methyltransferase [Sessilibacter corallicola]